jgi:hypothetical protein
LAISRSQTEPAVHLARAKALLAVSEGCSFSEAARRAGRKSGDAVAHLVVRFNENGLSALETRHGGGWQPLYDEAARRRILREAKRAPRLEADGTLQWSLSTLREASKTSKELPEPGIGTRRRSSGVESDRRGGDAVVPGKDMPSAALVR